MFPPHEAFFDVDFLGFLEVFSLGGEDSFNPHQSEPSSGRAGTRFDMGG